MLETLLRKVVPLIVTELSVAKTPPPPKSSPEPVTWFEAMTSLVRIRVPESTATPPPEAPTDRPPVIVTFVSVRLAPGST